MGNEFSITPSELMEYFYCPRYVYFMKYLDIKQNEEKRYKVTKGREIHNYKTEINKEYLRKKLGVKDKIIDKKMYSKKYQIHGIVDEVLFLDDNTAAPLDYKFSKYNKRIYKTLKYQMTMYALMIQDLYDLKVEKAFLVFVRSKDYLRPINISDKMKKDVIRYIDDYIKIINKGKFPESTKYSKRCLDCTYNNICIK